MGVGRMTTLWVADTGKSSGFVWGEFTPTTPFKRLGYAQVSGGIGGVKRWLADNQWVYEIDVRLCEKFVPIGGQGFSQTLDSTLPLVIEGGLIMVDLMPEYGPDTLDVFPRPNAMYFMGGANKREKLQRSRAWLKEHGLLLTGKDVGQADADDAVSATLHAFAYLLHQRHLPTMKHYKIGVNV